MIVHLGHGTFAPADKIVAILCDPDRRKGARGVRLRRMVGMLVLAAVCLLAVRVAVVLATEQRLNLGDGVQAQVVESGVLRDGVTPYVVVLLSRSGQPLGVVILVDEYAIELLLPLLAVERARDDPGRGQAVPGSAG